MPFLRFYILFAFFAFSFAWADCDDENDFEIFAEINDTGRISLGCDEYVSTDNIDTIEIIYYGDSLTLSVEPDTGTYNWTTSGSTIIKTGSSFSPKFLVSGNPSGDITETYIVIKKGGLPKTIEVTISPRPTFTVDFDTDEADNVTDGIDDLTDDDLSQEVMKDSLATEPKVTLTKEGYNFFGWDFDFNTPITQDTTIKAIWRVKAYLVDFNTDGGTPSIRSQVVAENGFAKEPTETLTRTGYNFKSWNFDFKTPITKDTTIKAIWEISDSYVGDTIVFDSSGYDPVLSLSSKQRHYFVASPSHCEIKEKGSIKIRIMIEDPNIILKINNVWPGTIDEKGLRYEIPFVFGKLGNLDSNTLIYDWYSKKDDSYIKSDTILIETPVPFNSIVKKKWNNSIWFVNNNPKTNGINDSIIEFKWLKNNNEVGNLQYYSVTGNNPNDVYVVGMKTAKGNNLSTMLSTCPEKDTENIITEQTPKPTLTKQVLGIKEKSLNPSSKVYNLNGKLTKETPAGVYIVKEE